MIQADVRVVDVPVDDIGHRVAHGFVTQLIGRGRHLIQVAALDAEEPNDVRFGELRGRRVRPR